MSGKLITAAVTAAVASALAIGSCVGADAASAVAGRATAGYHVSKSGVVTGPSHAAPGYAELHVTGGRHHLFQLVRARHSGTGKATLVADGVAVNQGKAAPLEADFKAIGGTAPQQTLFVNLDPGTYYALDVDNSTLSPSAIQKIVVSGSRVNSARPALAGTITSVGDMQWSSKPGSIGASGYLRFENRSTKNANNTHFVELDKLKKGKTLADVKKALMGKEKPSDVFDSGPGTSFGSGIISFGKTQVSSYTLVPGKYFLACFFPDRATGQPHAFMGMYRVIDVG